MQKQWLRKFEHYVEQHPIAVLRIGASDWWRITESKYGSSNFTLVHPHHQVESINTPAPCLIEGVAAGEPELFFGLISFRRAVATLDSRIRVRLGARIQPNSIFELVELLTEQRHKSNLENRLFSPDSSVVLSPKLSSHIIHKLGTIEANSDAMQHVAEFLERPKIFSGNSGLQEDAVQTALKAFGLTSDSPAVARDSFGNQTSAITRIPVIEDAVIEHDARSIPGFNLVQSDLTGRAIFEDGNERLEVITANRRPLEQAFGVDLIYFNATQESIVMLQYKMLEPPRSGNSDWIYRPDDKLDEQIHRMRMFSAPNVAASHEYKLNPAVFYIKFVKRNRSIGEGGFTVPLEHFENFRNDPSFIGPRGGFRISYKSLGGRYLRQRPFLDLISSGYIGSNVNTTAFLKTLIEDVLNNGRAVVAAHQSPLTSSSVGM